MITTASIVLIYICIGLAWALGAARSASKVTPNWRSSTAITVLWPILVPIAILIVAKRRQ